MKPLVLMVPPALAYLYLVFRISAFRKDRQRNRSYFAPPFISMVDVLTRSNYTDEGQRLLPWLYFTVALLVVAAITALGLVARGP